MHLNEGKVVKCHLMAENFLEMSKWTEYLIMKTFWPQRIVCPYNWAKYTYIVYDLNIQTSLKVLGQSKPNFIWGIPKYI